MITELLTEADDEIGNAEIAIIRAMTALSSTGTAHDRQIDKLLAALRIIRSIVIAPSESSEMSRDDLESRRAARELDRGMTWEPRTKINSK